MNVLISIVTVGISDIFSWIMHVPLDVVISVENCMANHQGCDTIWNTSVNFLYRDLINGTLTSDRLQSFCRFVSPASIYQSRKKVEQKRKDAVLCLVSE